MLPELALSVRQSPDCPQRCVFRRNRTPVSAGGLSVRLRPKKWPFASSETPLLVRSLSGDGRQSDAVPELLETADVVTFDTRSVDLIEVVDAELSIGPARFQDAADGNQNALRDGVSSPCSGLGAE